MLIVLVNGTDRAGAEVRNDNSILGGTVALKIPFRNPSSFRGQSKFFVFVSLFEPCKRQIPNNLGTGDTHSSALAPENLCREPLYYFTGPYQGCKKFCADFCIHALRPNGFEIEECDLTFDNKSEYWWTSGEPRQVSGRWKTADNRQINGRWTVKVSVTMTNLI